MSVFNNLLYKDQHYHFCTMGVLLATCLLLIGWARGDTFTVSLSSALTLVPTTYTLNWTFPSRTITAASTPIITLSTNFNINSSSISACSFATTLSSTYSSTTCLSSNNGTNNLITFPSVYPSELTSETFLSIRMQIPNPWGAGSESISITILDSGGNNLTVRQTSSQTYTASPLNNCQWNSSSSVNGAVSTRTISFLPSVTLIQSAYLQVTLPLWFSTPTSNQAGSTLTCTPLTNVESTLSCNKTIVGSTEVYNLSSLFASNGTVSSAVSLTMGNLYNPWSLNPLSPISFQLYVNQNGANRVTQSCSGITQTTTTMGTFGSFSLSAILTTISLSTTSRVITYTTRNPIPATGGQLRLSWSGGITITYTTQSGVTVVSQNSSQITISGFSSSDIQANNTKFHLGWNIVNPPSTRTFTITLTSLYSVNGSVYGIDTLTNTYNCNSGTISIFSLNVVSTAINVMTTYTITFNTVNALTSGSYIGIIFPTYVSVSGSCSSTNGLLSCSVANTSYANISVSGAITANTSLSIKFTSVTNPTQAFTTSSFLIYTYYDSGLDSLVDRLISGMTVTTVANSIPTSNVVIVPSSTYTYASSNYIFSIQMVDKIVSGGYISVIFPSAITVGSVGLSTASFSSGSCSIGLSGSTVNLNSCFSADYATLSITFTLSGLKNPSSFQPTSSFSIYTYGPLGMINYINTSLAITMSNTSISNNFSFTPQVLTVHSSNTYTLVITFFTPHSTGDYLLLTLPSSMQVSSVPSCSATLGIALVGCSLFNTTTLKMVMSSVPSSSIGFTVSNISNYDISSTAINFQCIVYSSNNYLMEITPISSSTYTAATITTVSVASNNQIILNQASNITITLSSPFSIDSSFSVSSTSLSITIPTQFALLSNSSCISSVGSGCSLANSTYFQVTSVGISLVNVSLQLINIKLPYIVGNSSSFYIQYLYNGLQIATVSSGVVVVPYCISPCQQCGSTPLTCLSCLPSPNNLTVFYNNTCTNVCSSGLFVNGSVCSTCVSPCLTCTTATACLSCTNGTVYYAANNSCLVGGCPVGYYNDTSGNCSSCVAPCSTCTTNTSCLSCLTNYLYNFTCVNASSCPAGTFGNSSDNKCDSCQAPCLNCFQSATNCTKCNSSYVYYNNSCLISCPTNMYANSSICVQCVAPCFNCTSPTFCLSCSSLFFYNNTCLNSSSCPSGTFPNATSLICEACAINCSTCAIAAFNCTSCKSPYFNYNGSCVSICPNTLFQNGSQCSSCVSPCSTCSNVTVCLSCVINFYYTNFSCVNASLCPSGTFANASSLSCDPCTNNCTTCVTTSSNCSSCTSPNFLFNNSCSPCPSGMFANGSVCSNCTSPCLTCTSATRCLSCSVNYFTNFSCVNASSCPAGTFANTSSLSCDSCTNNCSTCSIASSNCTSCVSPLIYYNLQCISSCPNGTYLNSTSCQACLSPCSYCSSLSKCITCAANFYLSNTSCLNSSLCPNGTYPESSNFTCSSCPSICTSCSNSLNCTTCASSYYYINYTCTNSCPNGTFANVSTCSTCSSSCLTCNGAFSKCTSCSPGLNYYNFTCYSGCIPGTYNSSGVCTNCSTSCYTCSNFSICTGCSGSLYLTNDQCLSSCPNGTYADSSTNVCENCSGNCATCFSSSTNCSTCSTGTVYYNHSCELTCPTNYFNISGICTTCPNCDSCTNVTTCFICANEYYLYLGVCYRSCPAVAPYADSTTKTCNLCTSGCSNCSSDGTFCFSCSNGYLILNGKCYTSCPSGYAADSSGIKCQSLKTATAVYFPFSISIACISVIFIFSKFKYSHTDLIGNITSVLSLAFLLSVAVFTFPTYVSNLQSTRLLQSTISNTGLSFMLGSGILILTVLFISGVCFNIYILRKFEKDPGLKVWKRNSNVNKFMYVLISILSCFHFAIFRFLYSKLFLRECFCCYIKGSKKLLFATNIFTFIVVLCANVPSIALSIYFIMKQEGSSQTQIYALDNLIISTVLGIFLLIDMGNRNPEDFEMMLQDFPYLKKTKKYQDLDSSAGSLISIHQSEEEPRHKTQADESTLGKLGRVNIKNNLGNFGAIDHLEDVESSNIINKTLPEFGKLTGDISFNPFELKKINDDLFFQEKQYTKKFNEIKQEYNKGALEEEAPDDDGATHHNHQDLYRETINVQEMINQRKRQIDPQEFLNKFKSQDYDDLTEEEMEALMEMAKQKGLDPAFIKQTFGKNKYYNRKILEELIGDHDQVSKESAQELFNQANSQSKLREVLGKKSTINTDKLIDIMNDPNHREIIEAMFNKDTGFLSTEAIKELLADNNRYSKEFIIKLLSNQNIDQQKLKILIESNKEGELDTLKTIKALGGENLEREERIQNMLGKQSPLNPAMIPKIKKEMSEKSISNVFDKKSPANTTMIKRIINNRRVNLSQLNPISQMPEIIEEFAELLTCGNEDMQQNLLQLLQNNNVDAETLKQLIKNSGNSQEEMARLLQYIKENKEMNQKQREETPVDKWQQMINLEQNEEEDDDGDQSSLPSLNFSVNEGAPKKKRDKTIIMEQKEFSNLDEDSIFQPRQKKTRTRFKKREAAPVHLPSEEIYLQRIQAPHQVQRNKKFRKVKKKSTKAGGGIKFMDQDNQVYDLDF